MNDYRPYVVKQGDYLTKLAHRHGFDAESVWAHPKNAELRAARRTPEVLAPGDVLYMPNAPREGLPFKPGVKNRYKARVPKVEVTLCFKDGSAPLADEPYEVRGLTAAHGDEDAPAALGRTDAEGRVTLHVPLTVREVTVTFPHRNVVYPVRIGDMDPETEMSGVQKRLQNLGFLSPDPDPEVDLGELIRGAIAAFKKSHGLGESGELDAATRDALLNAHGI